MLISVQVHWFIVVLLKGSEYPVDENQDNVDENQTKVEEISCGICSKGLKHT